MNIIFLRHDFKEININFAIKKLLMSYRNRELELITFKAEVIKSVYVSSVMFL